MIGINQPIQLHFMHQPTIPWGLPAMQHSLANIAKWWLARNYYYCTWEWKCWIAIIASKWVWREAMIWTMLQNEPDAGRIANCERNSPRKFFDVVAGSHLD
jgi:hypothetical protein